MVKQKAKVAALDIFCHSQDGKGNKSGSSTAANSPTSALIRQLLQCLDLRRKNDMYIQLLV